MKDTSIHFKPLSVNSPSRTLFTVAQLTPASPLYILLYKKISTLYNPNLFLMAMVSWFYFPLLKGTSSPPVLFISLVFYNKLYHEQVPFGKIRFYTTPLG